MDSSHVNVWKRHAQQFVHLGPPLCPGPQDGAFARAAIAEWLSGSRQKHPSVLVLGVTPDLCVHPLPPGSRRIALDKTHDMIRNVWPGRPENGEEAICADWRAMPLAAATIDLAMGDGALANLPFPGGYLTVLNEVCRVFRPGARLILRCFIQPRNRETPGEVLAELEDGRVGSMHVLKLRLGMAMQQNIETGVQVKNVFARLLESWPDVGQLTRRFAWPAEEVATIHAYAGNQSVYTFPTREQYEKLFLDAGFSLLQSFTPSYELGECCPTFVVERCGDSVARP